MDWGLNAVVRTQPELAAADPWRERMRFDLGHGPGLTRAEADEAALAVSAETVTAYVAELRSQVGSWIATVSDDDLERRIDLRTACAVHPRYLTDAAWAEVENLEGLPSWQILARPCISHVRVHIGEVDTLLTVLRAGGAAG